MGWLVAPSLCRSLIRAQFSSDNLAPGDALWLDPKTNFNPKNYNFVEPLSQKILKLSANTLLKQSMTL